MNQMPVRVLPDREARVAEDGAPRHHVSGHEPREPADREQDDRGTMVSVGGEPGAEYVGAGDEGEEPESETWVGEIGGHRRAEG
jgi:hypothetical protein